MADANRGWRPWKRPTPANAMGGLAAVPNQGQPPQARRPCQIPPNVLLHTVVVNVRWADTREDVAAVACRIEKGTEVVHPGPLVNGSMGRSALIGGVYEVTLPEVDADEWAAG